jgi:phosphomannomutase/phosphoglucomutase
MSPEAPETLVRLFGTNGIREVLGEKMTPGLAAAVAAAIARNRPPGAPIIVGWDGRTSSVGLARIVSGSLVLGGHRVIEVGLLPTPAIQYSVTALGGQVGVIVTASHNPPEFNGIKCIAADGLEVTREFEEAIEQDVAAGRGASVAYRDVGELRIDDRGGDRYVEGMLARVDVSAIARRKFRVVLDCGNGASAITSPNLLRRLGCHVVTLNGNVDGTFPGHLSEPTEANLADLCHAVPALGADLGIAHDGDADRAVFVDSKGTYLPGERTLTLLAEDAVQRIPGGVVVTPVSASMSVEEVVVRNGGKLIYTRVGSPVVTREMLARKAAFGGEENGGLIFPDFQLARDGGMTAAKLLDLLARRNQSLAEALAPLPTYHLVKQKIACPVELRESVLAHLTELSRAAGEKAVTLDGLKIVTGEGWILLRPSGTEPLIRVFAEAKELPAAESLAENGLERVRNALRSLARH